MPHILGILQCIVIYSSLKHRSKGSHEPDASQAEMSYYQTQKNQQLHLTLKRPTPVHR